VIATITSYTVLYSLRHSRSLLSGNPLSQRSGFPIGVGNDGNDGNDASDDFFVLIPRSMAAG